MYEMDAHAEGLTDAAEVFELGGDTDAAASALERAIELRELKGDLFGAERTRARLGRLLARA
jgi:hypothetical protein